MPSIKNLGLVLSTFEGIQILCTDFEIKEGKIRKRKKTRQVKISFTDCVSWSSKKLGFSYPDIESRPGAVTSFCIQFGNKLENTRQAILRESALPW